MTTTDNTVFNADRTVNLTLTNPTGVSLGTPATAVLTIANDDSGGAIAFATPNVSVPENGGPADPQVVRTGTNLAERRDGPLRHRRGTAAAGVAYTSTSGTLTFAAGVTSLTFSVPILNNTLLESDKTFQATLSNPTGGGVLTVPTTTNVTIVEDDTAGLVQFSAATYA